MRKIRKLLYLRLFLVKSTLVQEMDWRRLGAKPFLGPMMTKILTPICGSRGQWVKCMSLDLGVVPADAFAAWVAGIFQPIYE